MVWSTLYVCLYLFVMPNMVKIKNIHKINWCIYTFISPCLHVFWQRYRIYKLRFGQFFNSFFCLFIFFYIYYYLQRLDFWSQKVNHIIIEYFINLFNFIIFITGVSLYGCLHKSSPMWPQNALIYVPLLS